MSAPKCVGCPFRRDCPDCPWTGAIPAAATASDARTGVKCATIEAAPEQCANTAEGLTHSDLTGKG